ncbi:MAG TPA: hypothetical protein ENK18_04710 [Deltaproteobacteria bacterium]|nr:hypothetical protein [Deltaproteobacteria bacterium]
MWWMVWSACKPHPDPTQIAQPTATTATTATTAETGVPGRPPLLALDPAPTNLLMISIDTLRRDHVDRYAADGIVRMPFLTALLGESVVLDDHRQCSNWTFASTNCTLSGLYLEEGAFMPRFGPDGSPIPEGQPTLARYLGTFEVLSHLETTNKYLSDQVGNAQGYTQSNLRAGPATEVFERGIEALSQQLAGAPPERWFLHLHLYEPHLPYVPPGQYLDEARALPPTQWDLEHDLGQSLAIAAYPGLSPQERAEVDAQLRARYTADVRWLDDQLLAGWSLLEQGGWLDDTLVVIWTDHGEAFWEHDLQGHAKLLTREENDAVLAFWAPGLTPTAWGEPTHAVDLVPTVLDALKIPLPEGLSGEILGTADPRRPMFATTSGYAGVYQSVVADGSKLHLGWDGSLQLWDLRVDPLEQRDRYAPDDPVAQALWEQLEPRVRLLQPLIPEAQVIWPSR